MFGGDADDLHGGMPFGGMGGGMPFGGSARAPRPARPERVEVPLKVTLEELATGCTKKRKVTRKIVDGASGRAMNVEDVLEIPVKPGWKEGTKITFEGKGDEVPNRPPQDIVFVIHQIPHARFTREGDNLITKVKIPLIKAITAGNTIDVKALDNRILRVPLKEVVKPGYERIVKNEGMPKSKSPGQKGNLVIKFEIEFPRSQISGDGAKQLETLLSG